MLITGIILAGGQSTRMGTDKALIQFNGKTWIENAIEICKPVFQTIIISSNNPEHEMFGYKIIPDEIKNCGPLGGIYSCLKKSETDWNFVISVDSIFATPDFIEFLISEIDETDAVVPIHEKGKEPLVALYHKSCIPAILEQLKLKDYKIHNLLNVLNTKYTNADSWVKKYPAIFKNLNCPEDFIL